MSHCVNLQASSVNGLRRAGDRGLPPAEREEERRGVGDQRHVRRAGAGAASAQDVPRRRPGGHLQHEAEGECCTRGHVSDPRIF